MALYDFLDQGVDGLPGIPRWVVARDMPRSMPSGRYADYLRGLLSSPETGLSGEDRAYLLERLGPCCACVALDLSMADLQRVVGTRRRAQFLRLCADDVRERAQSRVLGEVLAALAASLPFPTPLAPHVPQRLQCAAIVLLSQRDARSLVQRIPKMALPEVPPQLPMRVTDPALWKHCVRSCAPAPSGKLRAKLRAAPWEDAKRRFDSIALQQLIPAALTAGTGDPKLWAHMGFPRTRPNLALLRTWTVQKIADLLLMREADFNEVRPSH